MGHQQQVVADGGSKLYSETELYVVAARCGRRRSCRSIGFPWLQVTEGELKYLVGRWKKGHNKEKTS